MPGPPYIQVAAFAEHASLDRDSGKLSVSGIFDKVTAKVPPPTPIPALGEELAIAAQCYLVVTLKGGGWSGQHELLVVRERAQDPETIARHPFTMPEGEDAGVNLVARVQRALVLKHGMNWFRVLVGSDGLTRIPLRLEVVRDEQSTSP